jgi:hypothetical protein
VDFPATGAENGLEALDVKDGHGPIGHSTLPVSFLSYCFIWHFRNLLYGVPRCLPTLPDFSSPINPVSVLHSIADRRQIAWLTNQTARY